MKSVDLWKVKVVAMQYLCCEQSKKIQEKQSRDLQVSFNYYEKAIDRVRHVDLIEILKSAYVANSWRV